MIIDDYLNVCSKKPIKFTVDGEPVSKLRARVYKHTIVKGNKIKTWTNSVTPDKTKKFENNFGYIAVNARRRLYDKPLSCNVSVEMIAYMPIPNNFSNKKHKKAVLGLIRPSVKPDCDNLLKAALDAMNTKAKHGIVLREGVYLDDKQVVSASVDCYYSDNPREELIVTPLLDYDKIDLRKRNGEWYYYDLDKQSIIESVNESE